jgi:hypothetical protein
MMHEIRRDMPALRAIRDYVPRRLLVVEIGLKEVV